MEPINLIEDTTISGKYISWRCPHCKCNATLSRNDISISNNFSRPPSDESSFGVNLQTKLLFCPNPDCKKYTIYVSLYKAHTYNSFVINDEYVFGDMFFPDKLVKDYPDYIPLPIRNDYREACLISSLSPKASATISRRCLQGIIRDFWKVKPDNLIKEIEQIKDRLDKQTYEAIDSVRKIGNIGAHMEKDINVIVDVDKDEANLLIQLLDFLIENWYIAMHDREERLTRIKQISDKKESDRKNK